MSKDKPYKVTPNPSIHPQDLRYLLDGVSNRDGVGNNGHPPALKNPQPHPEVLKYLMGK